MKRLLVFFSAVLIGLFGILPSLFSQNFQWANSCAKGVDDDYGVISSNAAGEVFMTGRWSFPQGIFGNDTLGAEYLPVMFSKLNASGDFQWTKGIKYTGVSSVVLTYVAACKLTPDVYFLGNIKGDHYFDSIHLVCEHQQMYMAKYDPNGRLLWVKEPGNDIGGCTVRAMTMDEQDNISILGWAIDTMALDGHIVYPGRMLARFSPDGLCIWIKNINFYQGVILQKFCRLTDGGFLLAGITIQSSVIIETDTLTSSTIYGGDLLLVKYDSTGKYLWSKLDGQTGAVSSMFGVTNDTSGNFLVVGLQCGAPLIFGAYTIPKNATGGMFLVKYDANGNALWATNSQSSPMVDTEPGDLTTSVDGKTYVTGGTMNVYGLDTVQFGSQYLYLNGKSAMFVACYDSNGNCLGLRYAESDCGSGPELQFLGTSVTADNNGNCIVAGQFKRNADFDSYSLTSMGAKDIFIARCSQITGVTEIPKEQQNQLLIYANPNTGKCNIIIPDEFKNDKNLRLQIFDHKGRLIQQAAVENAEDKIKLNIEAQAKGMYTAILSNGKKSYSGKIVIE